MYRDTLPVMKISTVIYKFKKITNTKINRLRKFPGLQWQETMTQVAYENGQETQYWFHDTTALPSVYFHDQPWAFCMYMC